MYYINISNNKFLQRVLEKVFGPTEHSAWANGPFICINKEKIKKEVTDLYEEINWDLPKDKETYFEMVFSRALQHELTHVRQWYKSFGFLSRRYLKDQDFRVKCETEAIVNETVATYDYIVKNDVAYSIAAEEIAIGAANNPEFGSLVSEDSTREYKSLLYAYSNFLATMCCLLTSDKHNTRLIGEKKILEAEIFARELFLKTMKKKGFLTEVPFYISEDLEQRKNLLSRLQ